MTAVLLCGGCGSPSTPVGRPAAVEWRRVGSWSGRGTTQIESFNIDSEEWRVFWETSNEAPPGTGRFHLGVHSSDSGREIALAADHRGVGRGTSYVRDVPRRYYFEIDSANVDWSVTAEQPFVAR